MIDIATEPEFMYFELIERWNGIAPTRHHPLQRALLSPCLLGFHCYLSPQSSKEENKTREKDMGIFEK